MRASRLVSLLLLLQTRGRLTAGELAGHLEVSVRTVYRDVDALSEAGVPIYAERGPGGGIRLVDGYRTRLTGLTQEEAESIFLSGLPGPAAELGLGTVVAAARLKVLASLPPELRARASRIVQRFHLDAPGWFQPAEPVPHLEPLATAVWDDRRLDVGYDRGDRVVHRTIDPLGLVLKAGVWYLVAQVDGQQRTYRVSRLTEARIRDERFERPPGFDLAEVWAESTATYERTLQRIDVTVRVPADLLEWLQRTVGRSVMATASVVADPERAGCVLVGLRVESVGDATALLLPLGGDIEVLAPLELRERLVDLARAVLARYAVMPESAPTARPVNPGVGG